MEYSDFYRSRVNYSEYTQVLYDEKYHKFNPDFEMRIFYEIRHKLFEIETD
jgi:hypothetical protein